MRLLFLLLLPCSALAQTEISPKLLSELGLARNEKGWEYKRISLTSGKPWPRLLNDAETEKVFSFLRGLPDSSFELALAEPLKKASLENGIPPDQHRWFEKKADALVLSALGKNAVPGALLGEAWKSDSPEERKEWEERTFGRRPEIKFPSLGDFSFDGNKSGAESILDPVDARADELSFKWGTAPRSAVHANNLHTLYSMYGKGSDDIIRTTLGEKTPGSAAARAAKAGILDIPLAYLVSLGQHEMGHFEHAWMGGSNDSHWVRSDGPYALGHVVSVRDWEKLGPAERQAFYGGGVNATQAALVELRRNFLEKDEVSWTYLPQWVAHKLDYSLYALSAPKPSSAKGEDYANDMVNYAQSYGARSGHSPDSVRKTMVRGAVWNMLDPLNFWAVYGYAARYVINGEERSPNPMIPIGSREYMASTGFELGETGPKYALHLLSRNPKKGDLLRVTPRVGDDHQWGLGTEWSNIPLTDAWRGKVGLELWDQRESAAAGRKRLGGAAILGVGYKLSQSAGLELEGGYKTQGDMLGQGFKDGVMLSAGLSIKY